MFSQYLIFHPDPKIINKKVLISIAHAKTKNPVLIQSIGWEPGFCELKFFSRLFLVDKTLHYENPYDTIWGVVGSSSYKHDLSPLEKVINLRFSHFS